MEVKILHHPTQEAMARQIGELLSSNGISHQITDSNDAPNGVHISVKQLNETQEETNSDVSFLTSTFVDVDSTPGY